MGAEPPLSEVSSCCSLYTFCFLSSSPPSDSPTSLSFQDDFIPLSPWSLQMLPWASAVRASWILHSLLQWFWTVPSDCDARQFTPPPTPLTWVFLLSVSWLNSGHHLVNNFTGLFPSSYKLIFLPYFLFLLHAWSSFKSFFFLPFTAPGMNMPHHSLRCLR